MFTKKISKRFLAILVALVMVVGLLPAVTLAEEPAPGTFAELQQAIDGVEDNGMLSLVKDYKHVDTDTLTELTIAKTMTIDLAGHMIDADHQVSIFHITSSGNLTIIDSNPDTEHEIEVQEITDVTAETQDDVKFTLSEDPATKIINGGCLVNAGSLTEMSTAGCIKNEGILTMNAGTIFGSVAAIGAAAIENAKEGKIYFNGGTIDSARAGLGVGGINNNGRIEMTGGQIINCSGIGVGGIDNDEEATLIITGGSIRDCNAIQKAVLPIPPIGGIYAEGPVKVGGTAVIKDNYVLAPGIAQAKFPNNIACYGADEHDKSAYQPHPVLVEFVEGKPLTDGADIGVTAYVPWKVADEVFIPGFPVEGAEEGYNYFSGLTKENCQYFSVNNGATQHQPTYGITQMNNQFVLGEFHNITIAEGIEHGTVTASRAQAVEGQMIQLNVTPEEGYQLKEGSLTLTTASGHTSKIAKSLSFGMTPEDVTINAEFEAVPAPVPTPEPTPTDDKNVSTGINGFDATVPAALVFMGLALMGLCVLKVRRRNK